MKITDVKTRMVAVPFARFGEFKPVTMWYMRRYANLHCVTFIETDEGITGVGTQGDQDLIMNVIKPKLIGRDPFDIENIEQSFGGPIGGKWRIPTDTLAAIDGALWDIIGKKCGQPLYKLWGGKINAPIAVRYWMDCGTPEEQAEEAVEAVKRGWRAFKIKVGTDPKTDLERVRQIREAVGYDIQLNVDLNGGYPMYVAVHLLKKLAKYDIAMIEDPVPSTWPYDPGCLENMADIRRMTGMPIEAHSHGPNVLEFVKAVIEKRAADAIHLNLSFGGPVLDCKRVCAVAEAGGLIVTGQSSCAELGPRNALLLHLITSEQAFKGTHDSSTHHLEPPSGDIIKNEFRTVNGTLQVPEGPGLGVEIDEEKLDKYSKLYETGEYQHGPGLGRKDSEYWF